MTILLLQITQISSMKVIGFMVHFLKMVKLEFYGEWQKVATHHRTFIIEIRVIWAV